jgi:hypothetical protein
MPSWLHGDVEAQPCRRTARTSARDLTECFFRLANADNGAFERVGRHGASLWRPMQVILTLATMKRYEDSGPTCRTAAAHGSEMTACTLCNPEATAWRQFDKTNPICPNGLARPNESTALKEAAFYLADKSRLKAPGDRGQRPASAPVSSSVGI